MHKSKVKTILLWHVKQFCLLELITQSICNQFTKILYHSLSSLSLFFPRSYNLVIHLVYSLCYTFSDFFGTPGELIFFKIPDVFWLRVCQLNQNSARLSPQIQRPLAKFLQEIYLWYSITFRLSHLNLVKTLLSPPHVLMN